MNSFFQIQLTRVFNYISCSTTAETQTNENRKRVQSFLEAIFYSVWLIYPPVVPRSLSDLLKHSFRHIQGLPAPSKLYMRHYDITVLNIQSLQTISQLGRKWYDIAMSKLKKTNLAIFKDAKDAAGELVYSLDDQRQLKLRFSDN